jgi:5-methyltetrahydropteroyltriglutamate--homocysteine methyltransferase
MSRIQTTHVGSLPRNALVADLLFSQEKELPLDPARVDAAFAEATAAIVARQRQVGIDIPSDGETSKISYATYIKDRLTGFSGDSPRRVPGDLMDYPAYAERIGKSGGTPTYRRPRCTGPVAVKSMEPLARDIGRMKDAMAAAGYGQGFMNAASPGVIALFQPSDVHADTDAYLADLAEAMAAEYEAIVASGLILQVDAPDLALGRHMMYADLDEAAFLKRAERHVEALNHALRNVPADRVRMHLCWGNYEGPHTRDIPLASVLPVVLKAKPRALLFEAANPRHAHEWTVWRDMPVPDDYVLIPGCLDSTTNVVEHPELVAQRILTFAGIVGSDRVVAGTDCGFGTFAGYGAVHGDIAWAKLASLVEGAARASDALARHRAAVEAAERAAEAARQAAAAEAAAREAAEQAAEQASQEAALQAAARRNEERAARQAEREARQQELEARRAARAERPARPERPAADGPLRPVPRERPDPAERQARLAARAEREARRGG